MPYKQYRCCVDSVTHHYLNQAGHGLSYYQGSNLQRGYGIGSIFGSLFRSAIPLFKSGARALGKQVLRSGVDFANDLVQGRDARMAATERAKEAGRMLTDKASGKLKKMLGGHKRKRKVKNRVIRKRVRKASTPDIFD